MLKRITTRGLVVAVILGSLPFALALALSYLRPDLIAPMLQTTYGYVMISVVTLLVMLSTAAYVLVGTSESRGARIGVTIAIFVLGTLPALLLVLFGPIVFAFMFGTVG